jgi:hypothetical protein
MPATPPSSGGRFLRGPAVLAVEALGLHELVIEKDDAAGGLDRGCRPDSSMNG